MRLVMHHLRKDLRALWPWLVLWLGVLMVLLFLPEESSGMARSDRLRTLLAMVQWALAAVLPAMLILQDPVDGTRAFWLTRPISRRRLLASKGLGLAVLFVAVPLAFQLAALRRAGITGWPLAAGLAETGLYVGGLCLAFAALASASSNLARFVLLLVAYSLAATFLGPTLIALTPMARGFGGPLSLANSRDVVELLLLPLLAAVMLAYQWRTRRTVRSLVFAGVAVVGLSWTSVWPWDFLAPPAEPLDGAEVVGLEPASDSRCLDSMQPIGQVPLCARLLFAGPRDGLDLEIQRLRSRLTLPDGTAIEHLVLGHAGWVHSRVMGERDRDAGPAIDENLVVRDGFQPILTPARDLYHEYAQVGGTLDVDILLASFGTRELGDLPIHRGATFSGGTTSATLDSVAISRGSAVSVDLDYRIRSLQLLFAPRVWPRQVDATVEHLTDERRFAVTSGGTSGQGNFLAWPRPQVFTTREQQTLGFGDHGGHRRPGSPGDSPATVEEVRDWLDGARLVLRQRTRTATYRASLRVDDFRMADYAPGEPP